ncbi:MAG: DUF192 domain-containing protein [Candidatus Eremiobacteraeota bacterium]|nr:DUF192 domain-containing protein [Candidatus Eremiobacteraeota bacterium]
MSRDARFVVRDGAGNVVADRVQRADTALRRLLGYLPRATVPAGEGLWFEPCSAVHMLGMRTALDIVLLDRERRVLRAEPDVRPGRLAVTAPRTRIVLELGPGTLRAHPLAAGDVLVLEPVQ